MHKRGSFVRVCWKYDLSPKVILRNSTVTTYNISKGRVMRCHFQIVVKFKIYSTLIRIMEKCQAVFWVF